MKQSSGTYVWDGIAASAFADKDISMNSRQQNFAHIQWNSDLTLSLKGSNT
jgi:hypothetical protein